METFVGLVAGFVLAITLCFNVVIYANKNFVAEYNKEPYCQTAAIGDREYRRCWKVVEVTPDAKEDGE